MKKLLACAILLAVQTPSFASDILIQDVDIFDGTSKQLQKNMDVIIEDNIIKQIGEDLTALPNMTIINGEGKTMTPGLIDNHWHSTLGLPLGQLLRAPNQYVDAIAVDELGDMLLRGVTTIRDAAGNSAGLKMAIDNKFIPGPRIYPSQALIGQYSGHIDFRNPNFLPKEWGGPVDPIEQMGIGILANGTDEVLAAARNNLYQGATQIKMAVTGGVSSTTDPLYVNEYTLEEIEAAVKVASDYGTYVMVHAHSSEGIQRAIKAGVKTIEHAAMADEETFAMIANRGLYTSIQVLVFKQLLDTIDKSDPRYPKAKQGWDNLDNIFDHIKKYNVKTGWGTDLLEGLDNREQQLQDLALREKWFTPAEILIQATGTNSEILQLTGKRNPYGKVGVIEEGAMADILLYSANPLDDINIVAQPKTYLSTIIKDGEIVKIEGEVVSYY
ncbi:hydrolase [Vibrio splendidus]|uniref:Amidohydrolase family protein n=1 Tax=Vibrio lentus TaxID=136468 RepID=A0A4U2AEI6_9VIBR|nr:amidohydrolase family protein [Vibrio lentus]PHN85012.1 hydrolase [Vibrio splendidus]MCC4784097.1 amidohydrolase family protein [Vibrio lentus]PME64352.1 hypothetical protein BCV33_17880 [Vibrio lentus]PMG55734.1 hypothetical protein BCU87_03325 [Vibrio lentus]PMJ04089.1 hypothetical protein BCU31_12815 [Vibrio lentus]